MLYILRRLTLATTLGEISHNNYYRHHFLASSFFGSLSKGVDFRRKRRAARSCKVPPHLRPRACSSFFNLSMPSTYHNNMVRQNIEVDKFGIWLHNHTRVTIAIKTSYFFMSCIDIIEICHMK